MISVIVPHFRDLDRLVFLLNHLNRQLPETNNWEVIVVNNDPDIPLVLPGTLSVTYNLQVLEEPKPGSYAARNRGIAAARGEVIAFTDSDCVPAVDWLKNALELFSKDFKKEIGILTGPVPVFFKDPAKLTDAEVYEKYTGFTTKAYAESGHAITANWLSYRSVLEEFGCFNDTLKSNGDSELSGKISEKYRIVFRENIQVWHPARYRTEELVNKYRRLLGGAFTRKFKHDLKGFRWFVLDFVWKRYRFALKKLLTVAPNESLAICRVCHAINMGTLKEYVELMKGAETKR
jgi:glycosyltransferase involved in cell wall biosynthesis